MRLATARESRNIMVINYGVNKKHLTNHDYSDNRETQRPPVEPHAGLKMVQVLQSLVCICGQPPHFYQFQELKSTCMKKHHTYKYASGTETRIGNHILHFEGSLYAKKVCPVGFTAVFNAKMDVDLNFEKKCKFFDHYVSNDNSQ